MSSPQAADPDLQATEPPDAAPTDGADGRPAGRTRRWVLRLLPFVYLFVVAMTATGVHIAKYTEFSPIDELRHVDYSMRVTHFNLPRLGDLLTQDAMREEACRGVDLPWEEPRCGSRSFDPVDFRDNGYQTATAHPPTYYLGAGWFARTAEALGISQSFVDPARVFSALLLAAGLMVAFAAGRMAGVRAAPLLATLTLVPVMPAVIHAGSTVNPDATAILAGAVVMLVGLAWERGRLPLWALAIAGAAATGTKVTSGLAVLLMTLLFLLRAEPWTWRPARRRATAGDDGADTVEGGSVEAAEPADTAPEPGAVLIESAPEVTYPMRSRRDYLKAAVVLLGAAVLVSMVWTGFDRVRATIDPSIVPQNQLLASHGVPDMDQLFSYRQVFAWLPPWDGYDPVRFVSPYVQDFRTMVVYLFAGAMIVAALRARRRDTMAMFGALGVLLAVVGGPAFVAGTVVTSRVLITPEARYGMSLLPFMAAVVASFVRGRFGTILIWVAALAALSFAVGTMLGA